MTRNHIIATVAIAVALLAGALLTRRHTPAANPATTAPKPVGVTDGRADATAAGARHTAVEYVSSVQTDAIHVGPSADRLLLSHWLDSAVDGGEFDRAVGQLADARASLSSDASQIVWLVSPLGSRVEAHSPERARISVWVVRVVSSGTSEAGGVRPVAAWSTLTVDLTWRDNKWWVWSVSSLPGPAPSLSNTVAPASATEFTARLAGFELIGGGQP